jgi:hypothetical protein
LLKAVLGVASIRNFERQLNEGTYNVTFDKAGAILACLGYNAGLENYT